MSSATPEGICINESDTGWTIRVSTLSPLLFFYVPFFLFWTAGLFVSLYASYGDGGAFELISVLFFGLMLSICFIEWWITALFVAGHYTVTRDHSVGKVFIGIGRLGFSRQFNWLEVHTVEEIDNYVNRRLFGFNKKKILIKTSKSLKFGMLLNDERRQFLIAFLQKQLRPHTLFETKH